MVINSSNDAYVFLYHVIYIIPSKSDFTRQVKPCSFERRLTISLIVIGTCEGAIAQVASWLKAFRSATTEMSRTKEPMISTIHAIFRGLQDHVKDIFKNLPYDALAQLRFKRIKS